MADATASVGRVSWLPLIGLTGRRKTGGDVTGTPALLASAQIDMYYSAYAQAVAEAGGLPVHLPMDAHPAACVERLDGLLLSGGADIDPGRYGQEATNDYYPPEPDRDAFELALADAAAARRLPVLGICRGHQLLNVHGGGSLHQHVPAHACMDRPPSDEVHEVRMAPGSLLADLLGPSRLVNSLHHQTLDEVASDYRVTARSDDGTVEGLEHVGLPIVTVQWHPEMMNSRADDPLFAWLVKQASGYRASAAAATLG